MERQEGYQLQQKFRKAINEMLLEGATISRDEACSLVERAYQDLLDSGEMVDTGKVIENKFETY